MKLSKLPPKSALIKVEKTEKTSSGVYMAQDNIAKEVAKVLQIGEEVKQFKVGDRILFKTWAARYYKIDGEEFAILDEQHYDGTL